MSSLEKPSWFDIPREDTPLTYELGDETYTFSKHNTAVFLFREPYAPLGHVFHMDEEGTAHYLFDNGLLMQELTAFGFIAETSPWPSETDVEAWVLFETRKLNNYLESGYEL